jgi:hypothetical protein
MISIKNKLKKSMIISLSSLVLMSGCAQKPPEMVELIKKPMMELIEDNYKIKVTKNEFQIEPVEKSLIIENGNLSYILAKLKPNKTIKDFAKNELEGLCSIPIRVDKKYGHTLLLIPEVRIEYITRTNLGPIINALNQNYETGKKEFNIDLYNLSEAKGAMVAAFDSLKYGAFEAYAKLHMSDPTDKLRNDFNGTIQKLEAKVSLENCGIFIDVPYKHTSYKHEKGVSSAKLFSCAIVDLKSGRNVSIDKYVVTFLENESQEWKVRTFF